MIVFSYIWLPFMILLIWAAIERIPDSYLEASDLGAHGFTTLCRAVADGAAGDRRRVDLHVLPTMGDFITPTLAGGAGSDFISNVVYRSVGIANKGVRRASTPLVVMGAYLWFAKRMGAFDAL